VAYEFVSFIELNSRPDTTAISEVFHTSLYSLNFLTASVPCRMWPGRRTHKSYRYVLLLKKQYCNITLHHKESNKLTVLPMQWALNIW